MALSPSDFQKLTSHLNAKLKTQTCNLCGAKNWALEGHIPLHLADVPGLLNAGGPVLPSAAMVCQNCGNTHIINLAIAGIVKAG